MKRVDQGDARRWTLLGELYADGLGVPRDDGKAAEWYKLAAERGDREAMFALAVFRMTGRGGPAIARKPPSCSPPPPSSDMWRPPTISACSISKASCSRRISRAAELFRAAADAGNPEAQYALATLYKEGRGVTKDVAEAARLAAAATTDNIDAMVEYGIALFNGTGVTKDVAGRSHPAAQGRPQGQPDRAEPAGAHPDGRARHARRPGRSDQVAPRRPHRRRDRSQP